jgi:hypothetical protein
METDGETGKRRPDAATDRRVRVTGVPVPAGLAPVANPGGGNCLFHAVSQGISQAGKDRNHLRVRAAAVTHLKKHAARYAKFWDGLQPDGTNTKLEGGFDK